MKSSVCITALKLVYFCIFSSVLATKRYFPPEIEDNTVFPDTNSLIEALTLVSSSQLPSQPKFTVEFLIKGSWPPVTPDSYLFYSYALAMFLWNSIPRRFERIHKNYPASKVKAFMEKLIFLLDQKFMNTNNRLTFSNEKRSSLSEFLEKIMWRRWRTDDDYLVRGNSIATKLNAKIDYLIITVDIFMLLSISTNLENRNFHEKHILVSKLLFSDILSLGVFPELHQALEAEFDLIINFFGRHFSDYSLVVNKKLEFKQVDYPFVMLIQLLSVLPESSRFKVSLEQFFDYHPVWKKRLPSEDYKDLLAIPENAIIPNYNHIAKYSIRGYEIEILLRSSSIAHIEILL